jgi:hypothetical protein
MVKESKLLRKNISLSLTIPLTVYPGGVFLRRKCKLFVPTVSQAIIPKFDRELGRMNY